jgi:hypothetical protein
VPDDRYDDVRDVLDEHGAEFVVLEAETDDGGTDDGTYLFQFPFPEEGVRDMFEALTDDAGLDDDQYRVVSETQTVTGANDDLALASVAVEHGVGPPVSLPSHVTVTLYRGEDAAHPGVDDALRRAIHRRTGRDVSVEVRYLPVERATSRGGGGGRERRNGVARSGRGATATSAADTQGP